MFSTIMIESNCDKAVRANIFNHIPRLGKCGGSSSCVFLRARRNRSILLQTNK